MNILGISAFYHDSAAALVVDGVVVAAVQEERFTRKKQDSSFPTQSIKYCLEYSNLHIDDLDAVVYYEKPFLKFERLIETYYAYAPAGVISFVKAIPVWLKEKLFIKRIIRKELMEIDEYDSKKLNLFFTEHHQAHAASAFYPSGFREAAILTVDGVGEWTTASLAKGNANGIEMLSEMHFPHSLGLLYSSFTYFLGFRVNSGEYKLMGLAPYGIEKDKDTQDYIKLIKSELVDIKDDGSIVLNMSYFHYHVGLRMIKNKKWEKLLKINRRKSKDDISQMHCNLAYAIQFVSEEILLKMAAQAKKITGSEYLCMAGGVALNCVANGKILQSELFKDIYIQPAAGDAGGAVGAALEAHSLLDETPLENSMMHPYLGPSFSDKEILEVANGYSANCQAIDEDADMYSKVAKLLAEGCIVAWYQGRMEFGPRALGNRSILADPRNKEMQKKLNLKIKFREGFRPFAPSVMQEHVEDYFELNTESPYMLLVADIKEKHKCDLPEDYKSMPYMQKLYTERSSIQAVTHVDFSARIHTVSMEQNPQYYKLIDAFNKLTGCPVLVNTSFNVRGEPIVCTPENAYRCFMRTEIDYLIMGKFLFDKRKQPSNLKFKETFKAD